MAPNPRKFKDLLKNSFALETAVEPFLTGTRIQVTSDGQHLLCPFKNSIKVVSCETGKLVKSLLGTDDDEDILQFVLSPDDETVITAHSNGLLKRLTWQEDPPRIERVWKSIHAGPITRMCYDSSSTLIATGGSDATIKIWDTVRNYCTHNLKGARGVFYELAFKPLFPGQDASEAGYFIFGSADDYNIHAWNLMAKDNHVAVMEGHSAAVTSIKFTPNAKLMITSSRDKIMIIWNPVKFTSLKSIPIYESIESLILLPVIPRYEADKDENKVCLSTVGEEGALKFWNLDSKNMTCAQIKLENVDHPGVMVTQALYNSATNQIVTVTFEQNIIMYNAATLQPNRQFAGLSDEVLDVKFLGPDDSHIVVATNSPHLKVYELKTLSCKIYKGHSDIIVSVHVFSSDRLTVATSSKDNTLLIWRFDPETMEGKCIFRGSGHANTVTCVTGSNAGINFVVSVSEDLTIKSWNVPSHTPESIEPLVAKVTQHGHDKMINAVTISPNDAIVATASQDKTAKLWSSDNLRLLGTLSGHRRGIWFLKFSPVDTVIATGSGDMSIKIWSINDFTCLKTFQGHESSVIDIEFVARGMQLVTCASDGMIKLWTIKTGECTKTFDAHEDKIWSLDMNKDESLLVSGSADGQIKLWRDVTQVEAEEAVQKKQDLVQQEQILSNLLLLKRWSKALKVAILLEQPFRCLTIMKEILLEPDGTQVLHETLTKLRQDQLASLIKFAITWNTNSRHCLVAQCVLNTIFRIIPPGEMDKLPGFKKTVESLTPYTMKHYERIIRLTQQAAFADFVWGAMRLPDVGKLSLDVKEKRDSIVKVDKSTRSRADEFKVEDSLLKPYENGQVFFIDRDRKDEGQGDIEVEKMEGEEYVAGSESEDEEPMVTETEPPEKSSNTIDKPSDSEDDTNPESEEDNDNDEKNVMDPNITDDKDDDYVSANSLMTSDEDPSQNQIDDDLFTDDEDDA